MWEIAETYNAKIDLVGSLYRHDVLYSISLQKEFLNTLHGLYVITNFHLT